jgi:hypothetical protein
LRLEPDRLPPDDALLPFVERLRAFDEERPFAVVRPRPPPDEPLPLDELLLRLDAERLREPEEDAFEPPEDDFEPPEDDFEPPEDDFERPLDDDLPLPPRPDPEDFDRADDELLRRALDDERLLLLTSPSSMTPRQAPVSSSSISI